MKSLTGDRLALIDALVAETELGGVTAVLLEKDEHLTDALRALFELPLEGLQLVFCGGSSLSKAHGLIERMSEDADLKVVLSSETEALSRGKIRGRLRSLRAAVSETPAGSIWLKTSARRRRSMRIATSAASGRTNETMTRSQDYVPICKSSLVFAGPCFRRSTVVSAS